MILVQHIGTTTIQGPADDMPAPFDPRAHNADRAQLAALGGDPVPAARRSPLEHERDVGPGVRVKPLVWDEWAPSCFFGRGEFGDYSIAPSASAYHEGEIRISGLDGGFTYATAIEAAKAAAQADYEARILAALEFGQ